MTTDLKIYYAALALGAYAALDLINQVVANLDIGIEVAQFGISVVVTLLIIALAYFVYRRNIIAYWITIILAIIKFLLSGAALLYILTRFAGLALLNLDVAISCVLVVLLGIVIVFLFPKKTRLAFQSRGSNLVH